MTHEELKGWIFLASCVSLVLIAVVYAWSPGEGPDDDDEDDVSGFASCG